MQYLFTLKKVSDSPRRVIGLLLRSDRDSRAMTGKNDHTFIEREKFIFHGVSNISLLALSGSGWALSSWPQGHESIVGPQSSVLLLTNYKNLINKILLINIIKLTLFVKPFFDRWGCSVVLSGVNYSFTLYTFGYILR